MSWPDFGDEMPWEEDVDLANMADDAPLINLVDNTDRTSRDRVVLAAINAAAGAADSDSDRLARIRRLIAARGRARKVHEDDPPS